MRISARRVKSNGLGGHRTRRGNSWRTRGLVLVGAAGCALLPFLAASSPSLADDTSPAATGPKDVDLANYPGLAEYADGVREVPEVLPVDALDPINRAFEEIAAKFPDTYAGYRTNPDLSYTIMTVGEPTAGLRAAVEQQFTELPAEFAAAEFSPLAIEAARTVAPRTRFQSVTFSLAQLRAAEQRLLSWGDTLEVWAIEFDTVNNQLVVDVLDTELGRQTAEKIVASQPAGMVRVNAGPAPRALVGRFDDSPPWNGGNQIVSYSNPANACTTNFGFHSNNTGYRYVFTAGHCGPDYWYNTWVGYPSFTLANLLGITSGGVHPVSGGSGIDAQALDPGSVNGSSCLTWTGISNPPYPVGSLAITGYSDVVAGAGVLTEGSMSFEQSATVIAPAPYVDIAVNGSVLPNYRVINVFKVNVGQVGGDSGGTVVYPTIYGPLAAGMITAGDTLSGTSWHQQINSLRFAFQATPNVSTNGYSC